MFKEKKNSNQYGNGYYPGVEFKKIQGLPEIVSYSDCPNCSDNIYKNYISDTIRNTQPIKPITTQSGGLYKFIKNPVSKRNISIRSHLAKKLLKKYILNITGGTNTLNTILNQPKAHIGSNSNFDNNMNNRIFSCDQPIWNPECI